MAQAESRIIVALDFEDIREAKVLVDKLSPQHCKLKIGKQLFTQQGPQWVETLVGKGFDIFLDLKFHDIPHQVALACKEATKLGVWMLNVHASGGRTMLAAAREAVNSVNVDRTPKLIGVTVLTSLEQTDLTEIGILDPVAVQVERLAKLCEAEGLDGVVCSAQEAQMLRQVCGSEFLLVTPGIRLDEKTKGDQKRIVTPTQAMAWGVDYLVIGRPITAALDPLSVIESIQLSLTTR
ncbi:MAG: orotidine-5'-phosphate decarboxylase [Gammaproteobacteria bacterium]